MMEDIQNLNWWEHKGHPRGQHLLSPCGQLAIVCIPKCSSSYWRSWLERRSKIEGEIGWTVKHNEHMEKNVHVICLLRDPVKRWIAGISEYFNTYFTNDEDMKCEATLKLIQDRVVFDDHTEVQQYFYTPFDHNSITFFRHDDTHSVWEKICRWTDTAMPTESYLHAPINYTKDPVNIVRKQWQDWIIDNVDLHNVKYYYESYDHQTYWLLQQINEQESNKITI